MANKPTVNKVLLDMFYTGKSSKSVDPVVTEKLAAGLTDVVKDTNASYKQQVTNGLNTVLLGVDQVAKKLALAFQQALNHTLGNVYKARDLTAEKVHKPTTPGMGKN